MNSKKKAQALMNSKVNALKKIQKELKGASKMHAGQAKKIGRMINGL